MTKLYTVILLALAWITLVVFTKEAGSQPYAEVPQLPVNQYITAYNSPQTLEIAQIRTQSPNWDYLLSKYDWPISEARSVLNCESGGNSQAVGDKNTAYQSYGLFQIRALPGRPSPSYLLDPVKNVEYAYELYKKSSWIPWTCKPQ